MNRWIVVLVGVSTWLHCLLWRANGFTCISRSLGKADSAKRRTASALEASRVENTKKDAKVGDLLSYLPTPSFIVELSLMEKWIQEQRLDCTTMDEFFQDPSSSILQQTTTNQDLADSGAFFVHTTVTCTDKRDAVVQQEGSGKSLSVCNVDTSVESVSPKGAYLGLGLANHHVGGYYWARSMGIGASLPAHGIYFGPPSANDDNPLHGELTWKKRGPGDPAETTEESSNSNDGKRSEWADFLKVGDTVQLVPFDPLSILMEASTSCSFNVLLGLRRAGRPLGADPIVEKMWTRSSDGKGWTVVEAK
ncbi:expressed unknown protein [Seminavis robusta]|uniref:Uncharacterized protein n=1 Tax=Seminavis robusta TaxID=568900 RepID=A0A9N8H614_9STRA|nr:expressed unknown protein [Seminavis robusta]|eukprot:Sro132_g062430.1 n/a (307) ;mRNA; r:16103-17023